MNVERLLRLAKFLDTRPRDLYHMRLWVEIPEFCAAGISTCQYDAFDASQTTIAYAGRISFSAAAWFMDLEDEVAFDLFGNLNGLQYLDCRTVSQRIRKLLCKSLHFKE